MKLMDLILITIMIASSLKIKTNELYLNLIKKCLINSIYEDKPYIGNFNLELREKGYDGPQIAHTMIGLVGLNNIQFCIEDILKNNIPGDFIETGVHRGGATIFMRAMLKAYNIINRIVWVADSFEGLPKINEEKYPEDKQLENLHYVEQLKVSLDIVKNNFKKYDLLDNQVKFLKGWFKDSLPKAPIQKLALLRLDGDYYESTMDALTSLYPKLAVGGYVIVDDYHLTPCVSAIRDYRNLHDINDKIEKADHRAYWKKTK